MGYCLQRPLVRPLLLYRRLSHLILTIAHIMGKGISHGWQHFHGRQYFHHHFRASRLLTCSVLVASRQVSAHAAIRNVPQSRPTYCLHSRSSFRYHTCTSERRSQQMLARFEKKRLSNESVVVAKRGQKRLTNAGLLVERHSVRAEIIASPCRSIVHSQISFHRLHA